METIDWRELYAANRAVIQRHLPEVAGLRARGLGIPARGPDAGDLSPLPALLRAGRPADTARFVEHHDGRRVRRIRVHVPERLDRSVPAPLVLALHGCTQTAATFASGALLDDEADRHGFVVAYPEQLREDNPQGCWNWFSAGHQARGAGEPAFLAGATEAVRSAGWTIDRDRVFVVGMSAGAAMASVLAATYPDVIAALAMHSGLAFGCALNLPAATQAMTRGGPDPEAQGRVAFAPWATPPGPCRRS
jgi:poly(hydroxyalkanoate) depolymerase family esterase